MDTFDLASLDTKAASEKGGDMILKNPGTMAVIKGTDGNPIVFHILGKHSERYVKASNKQQNRRLKEMRGRAPQASTEEINEDINELLSVAITSWTDNFTMGGEPFPYSPVNARKLMSDERVPWIREQVNEFIGDLSNFLDV